MEGRIMLKRISLIFDDDTVVFMSGDADHIADMIKGQNFKGFVLHEGEYRTGISKEELNKLYKQEYANGGWDLKAIKKLLDKK